MKSLLCICTILDHMMIFNAIYRRPEEKKCDLGFLNYNAFKNTMLFQYVFVRIRDLGFLGFQKYNVFKNTMLFQYVFTSFKDYYNFDFLGYKKYNLFANFCKCFNFFIRFRNGPSIVLRSRTPQNIFLFFFLIGREITFFFRA